MMLVAAKVMLADGSAAMRTMDISMAFCFPAFFHKPCSNNTGRHGQDGNADDEDGAGKKLAQGRDGDHITIPYGSEGNYCPPERLGNTAELLGILDMFSEVYQGRCNKDEEHSHNECHPKFPCPALEYIDHHPGGAHILGKTEKPEKTHEPEDAEYPQIQTHGQVQIEGKDSQEVNKRSKAEHVFQSPPPGIFIFILMHRGPYPEYIFHRKDIDRKPVERSEKMRIRIMNGGYSLQHYSHHIQKDEDNNKCVDQLIPSAVSNFRMQ